MSKKSGEMSNVVYPLSKDLGNTIPSPKKRVSVSKYWCFTFNNYSEDELSKCLSMFANKNCKYIIGKEKGENETPHLQGYIEAPKAIRPLEFFGLSEKIHWEKRKGNREQNIKYCSKEGDYKTNFESNLYTGKDMPKEWYPWQKKLLEKLQEEPDDRKILWVCGGYNKGKSKICKYICWKLNGTLVSGCSRDALFSVNETHKIVCINVPKNDSIDYSLLESLKDGMFYSTKYEGRMVIMNPPHVVVFTNITDIPEYKIDKERIIKIELNEV